MTIEKSSPIEYHTIMKNLDEAKKIIADNKKQLKDQFHVQNIGIFGSYVRHEQKKASDIDVLVEFSRPVGFFTFIDLEKYMEKKLGVKVDLVTRNALKPAIGRHILREVSYI